MQKNIIKKFGSAEHLKIYFEGKLGSVWCCKMAFGKNQDRD